MSEPGDSLNDFGLVIAYVIPGLTCLYGTSYLSTDLNVWMSLSSLNTMSIASFILLTVVSVGAGLIVHTLRWLLLDSFHHVTGVRPKKWDFTLFSANITAYDTLTENHYRYHQFYGGMVISLMWTLVTRSIALSLKFDAFDMAIICMVFLMSWGSRDTLSKYYARLDAILTPASSST